MELGQVFTMSTTVKRGIVHIFVGLSVAVLAFVLSRGVVLVLMGSATFVFLLIDLLRLRLPWMSSWFQALFQPFLRDYEASRLTGASFLLVACLVSLTAFNREVAVLAISFLAVGDPIAGMVSERFGKTRLFRKTLEGALACLAACLATGLVWYYVGLNVPLMIVIVGAVCAAIAESLPLPVDDNITIPLFSGLMMWLMQIAF